MLSICVVHPSSTDPEIIAIDTGNHRSSGKNRKPGKKQQQKNMICNTEEKMLIFPEGERGVGNLG